MTQAYQMVLTSLFGLAVVCSALVTWVYKNPKQKLNPLAVLIVFSLLPLISIFRLGVYQSGDFTLHTTWMIAFSRALEDGNLFPQWAADLAGGLGYPAFIFQYQLPYYLASLYHFLGFSYVTSTKLFYATAYLLSAVTMYHWAKTEFGAKAGLIAAFLYQFSPIYFIQLHFYSSYGSTLAFAMLPLSFLGINKYLETLRYRWFVFSALGFALTILTHQILGLVSVPILGVYLLITARRLQRTLKQSFVAGLVLVLGGLLTTYYWLSMLTLTQFIHQATNHFTEFPAFRDFFVSPWKYGLLFQGPQGEIGWSVGYAQWLVVALSAYLILKKRIAKTDRLLMYFFFFGFWLIFVLMQEVMVPIWQLPLLNNFRLAARLLIFNVFFVSGMAAIVVRSIKPRLLEIIVTLFKYKPTGTQNQCFRRIRDNQLLILLLGVALGTTILNWGSRALLPDIDDQYLLENEVVNYTDRSLLPIWYTQPLQEQSRVANVYTEPAEIVGGEGTLQQVARTTTRHVYTVDAKTPLTVRENTLYFPGWHILANGQAINVTYQEPDHPGSIYFELPTGTWNVEVTFSSTPARKVGYWISGGTLLVLLGVGVMKRLKNN